jgi:hypothetical protein
LKGITAQHGRSSSTNMTTIKAGTTSTTAFMIEPDVTGELTFQAGNTTPMTIANTGVVSFANTATLKVPVGGINSRPATPANGMLRYNSDFEEFEGYSNSKWNLLTLSSMKLKLDFDQTTTLPTGISFTRATSGTYFNSSGVLTTAGSGVARFDHRLEGTTWVNKGLLIEEARTNLVQRSEEFNDVYWEKGTGTSAINVTSNTGTAPDGTTTADSLIPPVGATNGPVIFRSGISITANTFYTLSLFVQSISGYNLRLQFNNSAYSNGIQANFNLGSVTSTGNSFGSGSFLSSTITNVGGGFYHITITGKVDTTTTTNCIVNIYIFNENMQFSYTPNGTSGIRAWGAQLEAGAFPTSYIATTSASGTRNADLVSMTGTNFSSWYNATEGTVFWQGDTVNTSTATGQNPRGWGISDNTNSERMAFSVGIEGNTRTFFVIDNNATQCNIFSPDPAVALVASQTYKAASVYKLNDFAHTLDGNSPGTDTSGTLPTVDRAYLGVNESGTGGFLNGHIAKFYYWNTRKPNEFLQRVTE